eukprot:snap_masked-scaffold_15-processed-gene-2.53-mRNA-1 protein AED:0.25 eAED:0.29 QI:0/-1/0/1/-1/1/1/0/583
MIIFRRNYKLISTIQNEIFIRKRVNTFYLPKREFSRQSPLKTKSTFHRALSTTGKTFGLTFGFCSITGIYYYNTNEGFRRSVLFWKIVLPKYAHYKYTAKYIKNNNISDVEAEKMYEALHEKYSNPVRDACLQLRGFYLKVAQIISTVNYFIPEQYLCWCRELQDSAPTILPFSQAKEIIPMEYFSYVDPIPVGSASIGQVYRAQLKQEYIEKFNLSFSTCAVKIQAPGTEEKFRADLATLIAFCSFALPQFSEPLKEIERQFKFEFDFQLEAENQDEIYAAVKKGKKSGLYGHLVKDVVVPRVIRPLCSSQVLVMELLEGESLIKGVRKNLRKVSEIMGKDYDELEAEQIQKLKEGTLKLKSIEDDINYTKRVNLYLDARRCYWNFVKFCFPFLNIQYTERLQMVNLGQIIKTISLAHGFEILVLGKVNGDPHPGNMMLLNDGRIGLLDYGQVKAITKPGRYNFAKLLEAVAKKEVDEVYRIATEEFGMKTKYGKKDVIYRLVKFWADNNTAEVMGDQNIHLFLEEMERLDPTVEVATEMVIPGRVSFMLRAVGNAFGIDIYMTDYWLPIAKLVLENENLLE